MYIFVDNVTEYLYLSDSRKLLRAFYAMEHTFSNFTLFRLYKKNSFLNVFDS
jgi:hypothetical protein